MEDKKEIWKDIKDCKYKCQISNLGRFKIVTSFHKTKENTITYGSYDSKGYLKVYVNYEKKPKTKKVHRLVAEYFLDTFEESLTVNHKDFNKSNNCVDNLEMLTIKENIMDYILKKKKKKSHSNHLNVSYHINLKKWTSSILINKQKFSLGTYNTEEEAIKAVETFYSGIDNRKIGKGVKEKLSLDQIQELLSIKDKMTKKKLSEKFNVSVQTIYNLINKYNK